MAYDCSGSWLQPLHAGDAFWWPAVPLLLTLSLPSRSACCGVNRTDRSLSARSNGIRTAPYCRHCRRAMMRMLASDDRNVSVLVARNDPLQASTSTL